MRPATGDQGPLAALLDMDVHVMLNNGCSRSGLERVANSSFAALGVDVLITHNHMGVLQKWDPKPFAFQTLWMVFLAQESRLSVAEDLWMVFLSSLLSGCVM